MRSAFVVSRSVSWNSGANVATTSMPYADQHMKYSHVMTSGMPPLAPMSQLRLEPWKSPVRYGMNISTAVGISSRAPVT